MIKKMNNLELIAIANSIRICGWVYEISFGHHKILCVCWVEGGKKKGRKDVEEA